MSLLKEKIELEVEEAELLAQQTLNRFPPILKYALIICVIGTIPAYYIAKNISHSYWQKQYKPLLLSAKPSFTDALAPKIAPFTLIHGPEGYSAITQISNQNLDLSLTETPYQINFLNSQNQTVYSVPGKLFLLPNQKKYIVVGKFSAAQDINSASLNFPSPLSWKKRLKIPQVTLVTGAPNFYNQTSPQAFAVEGSVQNQSPYSIRQIHLNFVVKDQQGQIIAVSQRDEFNLYPGQVRSFKQLWPGNYFDQAYKVEVTAETNPLDLTNLTLQQSPATNSSDLSRPDYNPFQ